MGGHVEHGQDQGRKLVNILPLVYKNWNKNSNFIIGVNYLQSSGDVWTSLGLKKEVKKNLCERRKICPLVLGVSDKLYLGIPKWITQALAFYSYKSQWFEKEIAPKESSLLFFTHEYICFRDFLKLFCLCASMNMDLFIYNLEDLSLFNLLEKKKVSSWNQPRQQLYMSKKEDFFTYLEGLNHESAFG